MGLNRLVEIWPDAMAHASGALWLPKSRTLALADVHLGYSWAQRRKGELGPLADRETRLKILNVLDELNPLKVILAGDIVHAPNPGLEESAFINGVLTELRSRAEVVGIRGNHDRGFTGMELIEEWQEGDIKITHGDRLPEDLVGRLCVGHLHPAIGLEDAAGVKQRIPAFLAAGPIVVMPAFSPFAAGLDVWRSMPVEILQLARGAEPEAIAVTGTRAVKLGLLHRLVSPAKGSRPSDYRRRR